MATDAFVHALTLFWPMLYIFAQMREILSSAPPSESSESSLSRRKTALAMDVLDRV